MNPLIAKVCKLIGGDGAEFAHWFDASEVIVKNEGVLVDMSIMLDCVLPYPMCVIAWSDGSVTYAITLAQNTDGDILCISQKLEPEKKQQRIFWFGTVDSQIKFWPADGNELPPDHIAQGICAQVAYWYSSLNSEQVAYTATRVGTPAQQAKRARHGKAPMFDWHTVTIKPKQSRVEPQGGTHASPRLHDRRGHWRKCPSGKQVWVRNCKVGDASKGVVFKDYKVAQ